MIKMRGVHETGINILFLAVTSMAATILGAGISLLVDDVVTGVVRAVAWMFG